MPTAWAEGTERSLLAPGFQRVVPLLAAFDDSPFGTAARAELDLLVDPRFEAVQLRCALSEVEGQMRHVTSAGFQTSIAPLDLIPNQAAWCCFFQDLTGGGAAGCGTLDRRARWLLFLKVREAADAASVLEQAQAANGSCTVFLLGEEGELHREVDLLAEGAVCLLLAGWERFCTTGDLSFDKALLLSVPRRAHVLGVGSNGIDLPYHRARWAGKIAGAVAARWGQPAAGAGDMPPPDAMDTLRLLVPKRGYTVTERGPRPGLVLGNLAVELAWSGGDEHRPLPGASGKEDMRHYLSIVQDTSAFLRSMILPNTRRFMQQQARAVIEQNTQKLPLLLALPDSPEGLFPLVQKRLTAFREPFARLAQCRASGLARGDFRSLLAEAHRRIDAVPSLEGAFLRLALIAIGLIWLAAGPLVWSGIRPGAGESGPWSFLWPLVLLGILLVAVPATYAFRLRRAIRAMEAARRAMIDGHIREVCESLAAELRTVGESLCRILDQKESEVSALARALGAGTWLQPAEELRNRRSRFDDGAIDLVLTPRLADLVAATHEGFAQRMKARSLTLDFAQWKDELIEESTLRVQEILARTRFDQLASGANPAHGSRRTMLETVVTEARKPSLAMQPSAVAPPVVCIAPLSWEPELSDLINVQLYFLAHRNLVAVSVRPLEPAPSAPSR